MKRDEVIGGTLILAEKYNALIEEKNLPFPSKINLTLLELKLENCSKTEILCKNRDMLNDLTQLKNHIV